MSASIALPYTNMQTDDSSFDLTTTETQPARRASFVPLMTANYVYFPEYETAEQLADFLLALPSDYDCVSHLSETAPTARRQGKPPLQTVSLDPIVVHRQVGLTSILDRQAKIKRYLEKRQRRCWVKRISYDCRKQVADSRVRCKGRFVAKHSATPV